VLILSEDIVKQLAEAKSYLESKLKDLENEVTTLRSILKVVDQVLTEKSFKKAKITKGIEEKGETPTVSQEKYKLSTIDGILLGELNVKEGQLLLTPAKGLQFQIDLPPFASFLVNRVLEPMRKKDIDAITSGDLKKDDAFNYELTEDMGMLKQLTIFNFGDPTRLNELKNAIRWTLRRLHEKRS
jgi:hypothetical protein